MDCFKHLYLIELSNTVTIVREFPSEIPLRRLKVSNQAKREKPPVLCNQVHVFPICRNSAPLKTNVFLPSSTPLDLKSLLASEN